MKKYTLLIFCIISIPVLAQKHDNIWLTGYDSNPTQLEFGGTIYDFSNHPPEIYYHYTGLNLYLTNVNMSDKSGNLLFYSNGGYIFNANHELMENGDSLSLGEYADAFADYGFSVTQGALVLPKPNHDSIYLLFHNKVYPNGSDPSTYDLLMTEINMNLDNGKGAVINKNQMLISTVLTKGKITATKHANGRDWWIMVFEKYNDTFYKLLLTPNGIEQINEQDMEMNYPDDAVGMSRFTPDGSKYIKYDLRLLPIGNVLDIYDFNRCTGELSNPLKIPLGDTTGINGGIAISPNSQFLYATTRNKVYQFDLHANDILNSKVIVAEFDGFESQYTTTYFHQSALAPNGKIYITLAGTDLYLHRINLPNLAGQDCQVIQRAVNLPTFINRALPNFPNYRLGPLDGSPCDTLGLDNHPLAGFTWETDSLTTIFSDNTAYEPTTWLWDFDGLGTDTIPNPTFTFPTEGNYNICQMVANQYDADTLCQEVLVSFLKAEFSHEADELSVNFIDESISEPFDWYWEFGDGETSVLQNPNHVYAAAGQYEVCLTVMDEWAQVSVCDSVEVDILDGVSAEILEQKIKIFPNPAATSFSLVFSKPSSKGEQMVKIYDIMGTLIKQVGIPAQIDAATINTSDLNSGIYWIVISDGQELFTEKLSIIK